MSKGLKVAIVTTVAACAVLGGLYLHFSGTWTDRFGFTHNVESEKTYDTDPNLSRNFALVQMDKGLLDYSDHKFIDTVSPILEAYTDKFYTTFVFDDGTGLYFPGSKVNETAIYGEIDNDGNITQQLEYITITGTTVARSEVGAALSKESTDLYSYYPDEFKCDNSWVAANEKDNSLYLTIGYVEGNNTNQSMERAKQFYTAYEALPQIANFDHVYISVGDVYCFVIDPKAGSASMVNDNAVLEKFIEIYE